jgi:hypothetical protein
MSASEWRICKDIRCGRRENANGPTPADVDKQFTALGWRGDFCPAHAHLDTRGQR